MDFVFYLNLYFHTSTFIKKYTKALMRKYFLVWMTERVTLWTLYNPKLYFDKIRERNYQILSQFNCYVMLYLGMDTRWKIYFCFRISSLLEFSPEQCIEKLASILYGAFASQDNILRTNAFKVGLVCLCNSKLSDKLRCKFVILFYPKDGAILTGQMSPAYRLINIKLPLHMETVKKDWFFQIFSLCAPIRTVP